MLQFPYLDEPLHGPPPPSLPSSVLVQWRPLVPIAVFGPTGKRRPVSRALLDSGADDTIFPVAAATSLGVNLGPPSGHAVRWRGQPHSLRFGDLDIEITDGVQVVRWTAVVGFSSAPIRYPI